MQVDLQADPQAFAALRDEWDELLGRSRGDTLFLRPLWLEAWWQVFGAEGALRLITVRDGGRLVGVAPLFLAPVLAEPGDPLPRVSVERPSAGPDAASRRALMFVGGTEVSDYLDLVVDREQAPAVYEALFRAMQQVPGWDWIDLRCLPAASPTLPAFASLAARAGLAATVAPEDVCPVLELPASWDAYLESLGKKERHELRRKMRNLERTGRVQVLSVSDPGALDGHLAAFMALHEASAPGKADFMRDPRLRDFFGRVARAAAENGWLDLSFLALDGESIASMFCFRYHGTVLVYNSGFKPEAWPSLSPGIVLLARRIQQAIEAGQREFDFLQGNERYKYDLGAHDRPVHRLFIS